MTSIAYHRQTLAAAFTADTRRPQQPLRRALYQPHGPMTRWDIHDEFIQQGDLQP